MANLSTEIKTIIGNLLLRADELSKRVLTAYDPSAKRPSNLKALHGFNLDLLEPCATFLGIALAESDSNKIYTKESLINRIMLGINALLPSQCSECSECYATEFDSESDPLFTCHMCFQVSHNCAAIKEKHQGLSEASIALLSGHVWLCSDCIKSSNPVKPRKSKSRHNSLTKPDQALSQIREELQSQQLTIPSPTVLSPLQPSAHDQETPLLDLANDVHQRLPEVSQGQICSKYKQGKCLHGIRGNKSVNGKKCKFYHPKRCFKYCSFGATKDGCKSGANCEYFHPTICKHSLSRRVCTYKDCTFVHLKGTKRAEPTQANLLGSSNPQKKPDRSVKGGSSDSSEEHFLELKRLVSEMTSNFNQEISNIKASLLHVQIHASKNAHFQPHPLPLMNQFPSTQYHQMPPPVQGMPYIPQSSF